MKLPKYPHNAIICGKTNSGKTFLMLDIIETYYNNHFDNIVIICPTYDDSKTYSRSWLKKCTIVKPGLTPGGDLLTTLNKLLSSRIDGNTLIIIDDCSAEKDLEKHRTALSKIAFHGRHKNLTTCFLSQRYTSVPKDFKENVAFLILTKSCSKSSKKLILDENDYIAKEVLDDALRNNKKYV